MTNPFDTAEAQTTAKRMLTLYGKSEATARCERHIASRSSVPKEFWREVIRILATA